MTTDPRRATPREDARPDWDPASIVELLADENALALFRAATTPTTVSELAERLDLSLSGAYRKVDALEEAGLLERTNRESANGSPPARYVRTVDRVRVTVGDRVRVEAVPDSRRTARRRTEP